MKYFTNWANIYIEKNTKRALIGRQIPDTFDIIISCSSIMWKDMLEDGFKVLTEDNIDITKDQKYQFFTVEQRTADLMTYLFDHPIIQIYDYLRTMISYITSSINCNLFPNTVDYVNHNLHIYSNFKADNDKFLVSSIRLTLDWARRLIEPRKVEIEAFKKEFEIEIRRVYEG